RLINMDERRYNLSGECRCAPGCYQGASLPGSGRPWLSQRLPHRRLRNPNRYRPNRARRRNPSRSAGGKGPSLRATAIGKRMVAASISRNSDMAQTRPLSPHLGIYRWQLTMTLSILHRATGIALAVGTLLVIAALLALAAGPEPYAKVAAFCTSPF